ncbi:MAG: DUF87 domain-containing protein [Firmicutes bacterium]|nr:DUF87 domain-containing protein [Bacillota bacterium]
MAVRMIPRKTKIAMELFKGYTVMDILWLAMCAGIFLLFMSSNYPRSPFNIILGLAIAGMLVTLIIKSNGVRVYNTLTWAFGFIAYPKVFVKFRGDKKVKGHNMRGLMPYVGLLDNIIDYREYYAQVIEVYPMGFGLLAENRQDAMINGVANALRRLGAGQCASLVKVSMPMTLDSYHEAEKNKRNAVLKNHELGFISDKELQTREVVFKNRNVLNQYFETKKKIYKDHFFFVIFSKHRETLKTTVEGMSNSFFGASPVLNNKILNKNEVIAFLKANYSKDYNPKDIPKLKNEEILGWLMPDRVRFNSSSFEVDDKKYSNFTIMDYPMTVGNAWGWSFFSLKDTRVVMNFKSIPKIKSVKAIDKALMEMQGQMLKGGKFSDKVEKQAALDSMKRLLVDLKTGNENMFDVTIFLTCEHSMKKEVRAKLKEVGFTSNEMFCRQADAFVSANVSMVDKTVKYARGFQTSSLAGVFPFISSMLQDPGGFYIGYNQYPVYMDFFKRDRERVNSNMFVIGRSGSGKSFTAKTLISHLVADDAKIFILDPENEYAKMALTFGGKLIDVGSGIQERFNPFHIVQELDDDDGSSGGDSMAQHLQFMEEFFKIILEGITSDAMEALNRLVVQLYKKRGVTAGTDLNEIKPEEYPIFDDLVDYAVQEYERASDEYSKQNYKVVINYISKFATGGRISNLWNGPTNIEANENFVVFSFRSILANRNGGVGRAQMLLVFKYLDNEIIKNREFNLRYRTHRKIIVVVDEAHCFISPKFPIALDFMFQMAKRIRKYGGMQIIITQNIMDFMGDAAMIRQSSAIIAACQYSLIMSLSPNDVTELVKLYKNAGGMNETEQDQIANAGRGEVFMITGLATRTQVQIDVMPEVRELFDD